MIIRGRWLSRVAKRFKIPQQQQQKKGTMTTLQLQGGINAFAAVGNRQR